MVSQEGTQKVGSVLEDSDGRLNECLKSERPSHDCTRERHLSRATAACRMWTGRDVISAIARGGSPVKRSQHWPDARPAAA